MRAPDFWGARPGLRAWTLLPIAAIYGALARARLNRPAPRAALPTIAIGGPTLGGDGKTPTALAIALILVERGERPVFLTRGYGRSPASGKTPLLVELAQHRAVDVGDEALLLAQVAPTVVGADRVASAQVARSLGATVLLLDDGLHSRRLESDLAILVVDADYGAGNGFCPPAGPLRAPLAAQIYRADVLILIGEGSAFAAPPGKSVLNARLTPDPDVAARLAGKRVFAFAGIGRPAKFAKTLREIGADVVGCRWFADHYAYSEQELAALTEDAHRLGAVLVTTLKDSLRIGKSNAAQILPISLTLEPGGDLEFALSTAIAQKRRG